MFVVVVVYGLVLLLLAKVITPEADYVVELNYPPATYNSEINPYIFVRGTAINASVDENKIDLRMQYRIIAYINKMNTPYPTNITYAYSAMDKGGMMNYFLEAKRSSLNVYHQVVASAEYPKGDWYEQYFVKVRYDINDGNETVHKTLSLSEKALNLKKSELNDRKFQTSPKLPGILEVKFIFTDDGATIPQYDTNIQITFDEKTPYHLNFQSWIVTEGKEIFPFIGVYNYCTPEPLKPAYETSVFKFVKPKTIYMKLDYTDENNVLTPFYYKVDVATLLNSGN